MAPDGGDGFRIVLAAARAAAIIHVELGVTLGGYPLAEKVKAMLALSIWPAVDKEDHRHRRAGFKVRRPGEKPMDVRAVFALELNVLSGHEIQFGHQRVVVRGEFA